jgi:hypothetical protein
MYDKPTAAELVGAVRAFLEEQVMPALEGRVAFHARVAANALGIVERQLELAPADEAAERDRLAALLGHGGSLDEQNRELCRRIRSGELGPDTPGLVSHLRETTLAKLAVDQPRYESYRRALAQRRGGAPR